MSKIFYIWTICNAAIRVAFVAGITVAAICMQNPYILIWYLLPALLTISFEKSDEKDNK